MANLKPTKYVLIDGAFFERICNDFGKELDFDIFSNIQWHAIAPDARRVIYYDALPVKKTNQTQREYDRIIKNKMELFNLIRSNDGFHVKDGITRLKNKISRSRYGEILEQKGVDTWIATDALQYALRGIADEVHIYTSDADLYPVFEVLQQTNTKGVLYYQEGKAIDELIFSADHARAITATMMINWIQGRKPRHLVPMDTELKKRDAVVIDSFDTVNGSVELFYEKNSEQWCFERIQGKNVEVKCSKYIMLVLDQMRGVGAPVTYSAIPAYYRKVAKQTKA